MYFPPPLEDDVRRLAYTLWEFRGCPMGSPDEDWLRAEAVVKGVHGVVAELRQTALIMNEYLDNYDLVFNERVGPSASKKTLGEKDAPCRFCGNTSPMVPFSKVAHAVPEAIGNKALTLNYECDPCNDRFSRFEDDFGKLVLLDRYMSQIRGKAGVPSLKTRSKRSRMDFKDSRMVFEDIIGDEIVDIDESARTVTVKMPTQKYRPLGVYKALVKMALSLVETAELPHFAEALRWLQQSDVASSQIDDGMGYACWRSFTPGPRPIPEPHLMIFRRKTDGIGLYCQFVMAFGNTSFQIAVPSPRQDGKFQGSRVPFNPVPIVASLDPSAIRGQTRYWRQSLAAAEPISTPRSVTFSFAELLDDTGAEG